MPGIVDVLEGARRSGVRAVSLSNDVSEWSRVLRGRFGLDEWVQAWVVSGDIGVRKPDPAACARLVEAAGVEAQEIHFVDDRSANVQAALEAGLSAQLFSDCSAIQI